MRISKAKLVTTAGAMAVAGMFVSQNAAAYAYAYSYFDVSSFAITPTGSIAFGAGQVKGNGRASRDGTIPVPTECSSSFGLECNIPIANNDTALPDNNFVMNEGAADFFSSADGMVPVGGMQAQDQAEAQSNSALSAAATENYDLTYAFEVTGNGMNDTLTFSFDVLIDQLAKLEGGALVGDQAQSNISFNVNVSNDTGTVFEWSPNGGGTATGGTVNDEPFSLQTGISKQDADDTVTNIRPLSAFEAVTDDLAAGSYSISVNKEVSVNANFHNTPVPEPASMALLGLGLAGIGAVRRRRARA